MPLNMQNTTPDKKSFSTVPNMSDGQLVMNDMTPRKIKTGGDLRTLPDYAVLRDEMSQLTHPARPGIHWDNVEQLVLLFEKNGIALQTGTWYTLTRSHLAQCAGMNKGLSIIGAMLGHQWAQCWPQGSHARAEILAGLFRRLQKVFRTFWLGIAIVRRDFTWQLR